jgi:DNA-directed RNA polymerase subunit M/transcription elongation factor TFIIS
MSELDLCPSCTRPMSWVRHVPPRDDDEPEVQVFECRVCKVILVAAPLPPDMSTKHFS